MSGVDVIDGLGDWSAVCTFCQNLKDPIRKTCRAFPRGIPEPIWLGEDRHTGPYEGDRGIQFEPLEEA